MFSILQRGTPAAARGRGTHSPARARPAGSGAARRGHGPWARRVKLYNLPDPSVASVVLAAEPRAPIKRIQRCVESVNGKAIRFLESCCMCVVCGRTKKSVCGCRGLHLFYASESNNQRRARARTRCKQICRPRKTRAPVHVTSDDSRHDLRRNEGNIQARSASRRRRSQCTGSIRAIASRARTR